ncbi:MAG: hypothetical protein ABDH28_00110 [Brevinematia bacterium]
MCRSRMEVEQSFRNMKGDLGRGSVMVRGFGKIVKFLFLMAVAIGIGLVEGRVLRGEEVVRYSRFLYFSVFWAGLV